MLTTCLLSLALAASVQTAAAGTASAPHEDAATPAPSSYTIGPQDQLSITVADEPELTGKFRVDNDGSFIFPYLGRVEAGGKSLAALQVTLTRQLANGYLKNPQVRVEVDQYKSKSV